MGSIKMSIHYNAFISYKHADLDNKIAAYVEKHLERYHIPAKIRKKTGIKKIERIFRDTDELPITSDLTGTIEEALKNADYLIVICSTNTCKSMWVEREIKLFLQNHPKEKILTVLADGEPVDVVPEILKNREVTRVDENGKSVTVIEPVEPLSCDFRLPLRTAKNVELPRLAAALIGCQYNELMDRQRQYKMKRLTAIFAGIMALSLCFGAYMFRSNQIIRESRQEVIENYRASLISQSRYLANESEKLLDNEQRIDALHLALAALPSEEIPDRPVVPEAERALSQATLAYSQRSSSSMASVWNYDLPNRVENMDVSADNNLFSAMDYKGNIKVWDTESHKELYSYKPKDAAHKAENIKLLNDGSLIITGSHFITSIDPRKGTENWNNDKLESYLDARYSAIVTGDGNLLVALDGQAQLHPIDNQFAVFSSKDGSLIKSYIIPDDIAPNGVNNMILSDDNTKIAFTFTNENKKIGLGIFDIPSEKYTLHPGEFGYLPAMCFSKENNLFISYMDDPLTSPTSTMFMGMESLKIDHTTIDCLSGEDFSVNWTYDFTCNDVSLGNNFVYVEEFDTVAYYSGNVADVFNASTGEVLHHLTINDPIVYGHTNHDKEAPFFVTKSGGQVSTLVGSDKDTAYVLKYFTDDLRKITIGKGIYAVKNSSNKIIFYKPDSYDKEWKTFNDSPDNVSLYTSYYDDNVDAILNETDSGVSIDFYDPNSKSYVTSAQITGENLNSFKFKMLGTFNGKLIMSYASNEMNGFVLYSIDYKTGAVESKELNTDAYSRTDDIAYDNGKLVYKKEEGLHNHFVATYDLTDNKEQRYILTPASSKTYSYLGPQYITYWGNKGYIYFAGSEDLKSSIGYIINTNSMDAEVNFVQHNDSWEKTVFAAMNDDATLIASTDGKTISINNLKGESIASISTFDVATCGFAFYKEPGTERELLIVPYSDGNICRYDASTGELVYKNTYTSSSSQNCDAKFYFDTEHSCIYLTHDHMTNIFDLETFTEFNYIDNSLGYHAPTNTFICTCTVDDHGNQLGYFNNYNLDDLIRKAKEILGDHEMTQDQKDAYGI